MNSEADVDFKHHVQVEAEEQKEIAAKIFKAFLELD
jgi:histidine triad domain protein